MINICKKNYIHLCFAVFAGVFFSSCSNDQLPQIAPQPFKPHVVKISTSTAKVEKPRYFYRGDRYRDPFIPLTDSGYSSFSSDIVTTPNIGSLSLKGILVDGQKKIAIISSGVMTYILKDNRLYDNRNRQIRGISGTIKKESVVVTGSDRTTKELKLRSKD